MNICKLLTKKFIILWLGNVKGNRREPLRCLGLFFYFKLGSFSVMKEVHCADVRPCLKLKAWPRFRPVANVIKLFTAVSYAFS